MSEMGETGTPPAETGGEAAETGGAGEAGGRPTAEPGERGPAPAEDGQTGPADAAETGPADAAETGPADAAETGPADAAETGPADAAETGPADAAKTGPADAAQQPAETSPAGAAQQPAETSPDGQAGVSEPASDQSADSAAETGRAGQGAEPGESEPGDQAQAAPGEMPGSGPADSGAETAAPGQDAPQEPGAQVPSEESAAGESPGDLDEPSEPDAEADRAPDKSDGDLDDGPATLDESGDTGPEPDHMVVEPGEGEPAAAGTEIAQPDDESPGGLAASEPRPDTQPPADDGLADRPQEAAGQVPRYPDVSAHYPSDYVESPEAPPTADAPHVSPEAWAGDINGPGDHTPGRDNNCGECARAAQSTWAGEPSTSAAMADRYSAGEPVSRMTDWAGEPVQAATMNQVPDRLNDLGPGSSAIVLSSWNTGGAHWFNAVNDGGTIKAVDSQSGQVEPWPPSNDGLGFDQSSMKGSWAIYFDQNGSATK